MLSSVRRESSPGWGVRTASSFREAAQSGQRSVWTVAPRMPASPRYFSTMYWTARGCSGVLNLERNSRGSSSSVGRIAKYALMARQAARKWLIARGSAEADITVAALQRLIDMASDAASANRISFPGAVIVRRRGGKIAAESSK